LFCLPEIAVWQSDHRDQSSQIPISMTAIAYEAPLTAQVFISRSEANDIVQVSARPSAVWKWGLGFRASTLHPTASAGEDPSADTITLAWRSASATLPDTSPQILAFLDTCRTPSNPTRIARKEICFARHGSNHAIPAQILGLQIKNMKPT
jgi:hypothetical protein